MLTSQTMSEAIQGRTEIIVDTQEITTSVNIGRMTGNILEVAVGIEMDEIEVVMSLGSGVMAVINERGVGGSRIVSVHVSVYSKLYIGVKWVARGNTALSHITGAFVVDQGIFKFSCKSVQP